MRDFKFRLWNECGDKSRMFYSVDEVMECLKQQIIFDYNPLKKNGYNHRGDGSEFMQYTGMKDKNGRDIYEGDILKVRGRKRIGDYNASVEYKHTGFVLSKNDTYLVDGRGINQSCEIIGNIYETPELLP